MTRNSIEKWIQSNSIILQGLRFAAYFRSEYACTDEVGSVPLLPQSFAQALVDWDNVGPKLMHGGGHRECHLYHVNICIRMGRRALYSVNHSFICF